MILTDLEKQLHELESPYAIAINKIKIIKEELNGDFDDMLKQVGDVKRVSAIAQLLASDYTSDKKLFTEKEELEGLGNEIKVGGKVFSSPYLFKEIPTDTILYYSRYSTYEKAPETKLQLYNDIIRFARKDLKEDFLRKMLTSDDLDINLIFGSDVHGHLEENHVNTEREKVSRVLLEQKPGTSIVTIEIPTPEEYEKQTGKVFDEDEYYEFLNDLFEDANEKINDDKIAQYIRDAIKENIDEIMFWFSSSDHELFEKKGADANEISIKYDIRKSSIYEGTVEDPEYIGSGYDLTLREKFTPIIKIPIRKDKFSPLGINAKTLYPDILDKEAVYSGKVFDLEEANVIGRDIAIDNSIKKRSLRKIQDYIRDISQKAGRPLTAVEEDIIKESEAVQLSGTEIQEVIDKVDQTYQGVDYFKTPMYQAFAQVKEEFTDKKIVTFFGNFKDNQRIEITPETFKNRYESKFHRCVIVHYNKRDNIKISFFQTSRAAGFHNPVKIKYEDLTKDEQEIFNYCVSVVKEKFKQHNEELGLQENIEENTQTEEELIKKIMEGPIEIPATSADEYELEK